jgi:hypothetical protein
VQQSKWCCSISEKNHQPTFREMRLMSVSSPQADITEDRRHVRFVPQADSRSAAKFILFNHLVGHPIAVNPIQHPAEE